MVFCMIYSQLHYNMGFVLYGWNPVRPMRVAFGEANLQRRNTSSSINGTLKQPTVDSRPRRPSSLPYLLAVLLGLHKLGVLTG